MSPFAPRLSPARPAAARPSLVVLSLVAILCCAASAEEKGHEDYSYDPIEGVNRYTFAFNEGLDKYLLAPVAHGWTWITPEFVRSALVHFDDNLRFPINATNDVLQWKWRAAGEECARFAINTTVGLLGFHDVASDWGIEKQDEDTGQTFGVWGIPPGPYIVLPLFGPSNPRDAVGLAADSILSVYWFWAPFWASFTYTTVDVVNRRAIADEDIENARKAALDFYVFVRNANGQRRQALIDDLQASESEYELQQPNDDLYEVDDDLYELEDDETE